MSSRDTLAKKEIVPQLWQSDAVACPEESAGSITKANLNRSFNLMNAIRCI